MLEEKRRNNDSNNDGREAEEFKSTLQQKEQETEATKYKQEEKEVNVSSIPCELPSTTITMSETAEYEAEQSAKHQTTTKPTAATSSFASSLNAHKIETEYVNNNYLLTSQQLGNRERPPLSSSQPCMLVESTHHNSSPHSNLAKSFFKSMFGVHSTCESEHNESSNAHDNANQSMNKEVKAHVSNKTFAGLSKSFFHFDRSRSEQNSKHASKTNAISHANSEIDIHHDLSTWMHDTSHKHRSDTPLGRLFSKTKNKLKKRTKVHTCETNEMESVNRNDSMCSDFSISTSTSSSCTSANNNENNQGKSVHSADAHDGDLNKDNCLGDNHNNTRESKRNSSLNSAHSSFVILTSVDVNNSNYAAAQEHSITHLNKENEE